MTNSWSVCYTVHCAHHSHRPLCRAHPERAALLFLVPGRRGRAQGCLVCTGPVQMQMQGQPDLDWLDSSWGWI